MGKWRTEDQVQTLLQRCKADGTRQKQVSDTIEWVKHNRFIPADINMDAQQQYGPHFNTALRRTRPETPEGEAYRRERLHHLLNRWIALKQYPAKPDNNLQEDYETREQHWRWQAHVDPTYFRGHQTDEKADSFPDSTTDKRYYEPTLDTRQKDMDAGAITIPEDKKVAIEELKQRCSVLKHVNYDNDDYLFRCQRPTMPNEPWDANNARYKYEQDVLDSPWGKLFIPCFDLEDKHSRASPLMEDWGGGNTKVPVKIARADVEKRMSSTGVRRDRQYLEFLSQLNAWKPIRFFALSDGGKWTTERHEMLRVNEEAEDQIPTWVYGPATYAVYIGPQVRDGMPYWREGCFYGGRLPDENHIGHCEAAGSACAKQLGELCADGEGIYLHGTDNMGQAEMHENIYREEKLEALFQKNGRPLHELMIQLRRRHQANNMHDCVVRHTSHGLIFPEADSACKMARDFPIAEPLLGPTVRSAYLAVQRKETGGQEDEPGRRDVIAASSAKSTYNLMWRAARFVYIRDAVRNHDAEKRAQGVNVLFPFLDRYKLRLPGLDDSRLADCYDVRLMRWAAKGRWVPAEGGSSMVSQEWVRLIIASGQPMRRGLTRCPVCSKIGECTAAHVFMRECTVCLSLEDAQAMARSLRVLAKQSLDIHTAYAIPDDKGRIKPDPFSEHLYLAADLIIDGNCNGQVDAHVMMRAEEDRRCQNDPTQKGLYDNWRATPMTPVTEDQQWETVAETLSCFIPPRPDTPNKEEEKTFDQDIRTVFEEIRMKCTEVCQQYLINVQSGMGANVHAGIDEDTDAHADVLNHTTAAMTALRDPERRGERATQEREDRETALLAKARKGQKLGADVHRLSDYMQLHIMEGVSPPELCREYKEKLHTLPEWPGDISRKFTTEYMEKEEDEAINTAYFNRRQQMSEKECDREDAETNVDWRAFIQKEMAPTAIYHARPAMTVEEENKYVETFSDKLKQLFPDREEAMSQAVTESPSVRDGDDSDHDSWRHLSDSGGSEEQKDNSTDDTGSENDIEAYYDQEMGETTGDDAGQEAGQAERANTKRKQIRAAC